MANKKNIVSINTEATAVVTLSNGNSTVDFVQFHEGTVVYIVNKVPTPLPTAVAVATIKQYLKDGWKKTVKPEDEKLHAPEEPKKPTRAEALDAKYGDIETRRQYMAKKNAIWKEEADKIAEAVKNGEMKRLPKSVWKKTMTDRVNARLAKEVK